MLRRRTLAPAVLAFALLTGLYPAPAHAANLFGKFGRGIVNTTTGWVEIPLEISAAKKRDDETAVLWFFAGMTEGIVQGGKRTLFGLWDLVTFPVPPYDRPVLEPETLISEKLPRNTTKRR